MSDRNVIRGGMRGRGRLRQTTLVIVCAALIVRYLYDFHFQDIRRVIYVLFLYKYRGVSCYDNYRRLPLEHAYLSQPWLIPNSYFYYTVSLNSPLFLLTLLQVHFSWYKIYVLKPQNYYFSFTCKMILWLTIEVGGRPPRASHGF